MQKARFDPSACASVASCRQRALPSVARVSSRAASLSCGRGAATAAVGRAARARRLRPARGMAPRVSGSNRSASITLSGTTRQLTRARTQSGRHVQPRLNHSKRQTSVLVRHIAMVSTHMWLHAFQGVVLLLGTLRAYCTNYLNKVGKDTARDDADQDADPTDLRRVGVLRSVARRRRATAGHYVAFCSHTDH